MDNNENHMSENQDINNTNEISDTKPYYGDFDPTIDIGDERFPYNFRDNDGNLAGYKMDYTIEQYAEKAIEATERALKDQKQVYDSISMVKYNTSSGIAMTGIAISCTLNDKNNMDSRFPIDQDYENFKKYVFANEPNKTQQSYFNSYGYHIATSFHQSQIYKLKYMQELEELTEKCSTDDSFLINNAYPEFVDLQLAANNNSTNDLDKIYVDVYDANQEFGVKYRVDSSKHEFAINISENMINCLNDEDKEKLKLQAFVNLNRNILDDLAIINALNVYAEGMIVEAVQQAGIPIPKVIIDKMIADFIAEHENDSQNPQYIVRSNMYNAGSILLSRTALLAISKKLKSKNILIIPSSTEELIVMSLDNIANNDLYKILNDSKNAVKSVNSTLDARKIAANSMLHYDTLNNKLERIENYYNF